jgi:hypothetical protein
MIMLGLRSKLLATVALAVGALGWGTSPANATLQIAANFGGILFSCVDNAACDTRVC